MWSLKNIINIDEQCFGSFATGYHPIIFKIFLKPSLMGHECQLPVLTLSFLTDRSGQTVKIQVREQEQSDQGLG